MGKIVASKKRGTRKWRALLAERTRRPSRWICLSLAIAAASMAVWWWLAARGGDAPATRPKAPPPEQEGVSAGKPAQQAANAAAQAGASAPGPFGDGENEPPAPAPGRPPEREGYLWNKPGQITLPDGKVLTFPPPEEGRPRRIAAYGHIYEADFEGYYRDVTPRRLFDTPFENQFQGLAVEGQSFIPTFLMGLDQDEVVELLRKPVVMVGDETDEEAAIKEAVAEMKATVLEYIEQGGTFDEFVAEAAAFEKQERTLKARGMRQVMELYKEGRLDEARERAGDIDAALRGQGFRPLRLPRHVREALGYGG